jgi:hypothetical protein
MRRVAVLAVAAALVSPVLLLAVNRSERSAESAKPELVVVNYNVADLPVWRTGGKKTDTEFGPEVLIKYIQLTVDPNSWKGDAEIRSFAKNASLVISQTEANHKKVSEAINSFRLAKPGEVQEQVRTN